MGEIRSRGQSARRADGGTGAKDTKRVERPDPSRMGGAGKGGCAYHPRRASAAVPACARGAQKSRQDGRVSGRGAAHGAGEQTGTRGTMRTARATHLLWAADRSFGRRSEYIPMVPRSEIGWWKSLQ